MRSDQVFVLLLIILIPMTGCFDNSVGDAEGSQDSDSPSDPTTGESTGTENPTGADTVQSRTWYSSGGVYQTYWDDGQYRGYYTNDGVYVGTSLAEISNNSSNFDDDDYEYRYISWSGQRCLDWGPYYDSSTGDLLGERCNEWGYPSSESEWDLTDCTDNGGEIIWRDEYNQYQYAPTCRMSFATINSSVGEALLIYEYSGLSITSNCNGVDVNIGYSLSGKEYLIAPGTALECSHEIYKDISYTEYDYQSDDQSIWSIVYAIQDTTVV